MKLAKQGRQIMYGRERWTAVAAGITAAMLTSQAYAQSAGSGDAEITLLKQQLRLMEQKLDALQRQTSANTSAAAKANAKVEASIANANAALPVKGRGPISDVIVKLPNNRPTICTFDDQNCISITSRVHFDVGGYDYRPNTAATVPQRLDNGENVRRARFGVLGKFLGDWNYGLVYDFGGSSDGFGGVGSFGATATTGGTAVGFLPGGIASGVQNAYLSYTGFKPFGGKLALEGGILDLPITLDEATSSNDILFLERATPGIISTNIATGDFRSAAGGRWFNDRFWVGGYVTGPSTGAIHSGSSTNPNGATEQVGAAARAAGQIVSGDGYSLHIGGNAQFLVHPARNNITGTQTLTLSDRPELRVDPTSILSTGAIAGVRGAQVYSAEFAGTYGPFFFQGEYFNYNVDRSTAIIGAPAGAQSLNFDGGYAEASYVLTGETRKYNAGNAAYNGVVPVNPFSLSGGSWGAWEIAARYSTVNLNDRVGTAIGVAGGRQTVYTAGLNWYVNGNIRFLLNYLHGDIPRQISATNFGDAGAKFDAVALRTQIAF